MRRKKDFQEIDEAIDQAAEEHQANKAKIENSLKVGDSNQAKAFAAKLNKKIESDFFLHEEMECKRREEESLAAKQHKELKSL